MTRHFLDISDLTSEELRAIVDDAHARKRLRRDWPKGRPDADAPAKDRVLAMIFQKNSTRTRFSFDAAIRQLGGGDHFPGQRHAAWPWRTDRGHRQGAVAHG